MFLTHLISLIIALAYFRIRFDKKILCAVIFYHHITPLY